MRTINKQSPGPTSLAEAKREVSLTGYSWPPPKADEIRKALITEQQGLCAYCMQRIKGHGYHSGRPKEGGMKIEHWDARSTHPKRMYDWDNLLGVCGGEYLGAQGLIKHCDTSRGAQLLTVNPGTVLAPRPEDVFTFKKHSPIGGSSSVRGVWLHAAHPAHFTDIERLNLNAQHLVQNRHAVLEELRLFLRRANDRGKNARVRKVLRNRLLTATRSNPLLPFSPLVVDYLSKKMTSKGMSP